jgi:lysine biosynthesis protein LysW
MVVATCPQCQNKIGLSMPVVLGQKLTCSVCSVSLEVVWLYPICLDYVENETGSAGSIPPDRDETNHIETD